MPRFIPARYVQSAFTEITVDSSTSSQTYVTALTLTLTTGANRLNILSSVSASFSQSQSTSYARFIIQVDGVTVCGAMIDFTSVLQGACRLSASVPVTAGSHTVTLRCLSNNGKTLAFRPSTGYEHASLILEEVVA